MSISLPRCIDSNVPSYVLFSIGNIKPLFQSAFKSCWGTGGKACNTTWIAAVEYMEVVGIIIGQVLVGVLGDWYVGLHMHVRGRQS